jgi:hypothetical protein
MKILNFIKSLFFKKPHKCKCGYNLCQKKVVATKEGKLIKENHFTCGKILNIIDKHKDTNL